MTDDPRTIWAMRQGEVLPIGPDINVTVLRTGRRVTLAVDAPSAVRVGPLQRPAQEITEGTDEAR
jgi:sRNA-binding carbon storage regulator CsrA